jgi:FkbM family methyltransferase
MKFHGGWYWPNSSPDGWTAKLPVDDTGRIVYSGRVVGAALAVCRRRRVAVDAGAHIGLIAARLLERFAHVHAFEPFPANAECLAVNCASERLTIHQAALADRSGTGQLHGVDGKPMGYSLEPFRGGATAEVRTIALDDMGLDLVDFIKLDVEGGEYNALLGAYETLQRCHPVVLIEEKFDPECRASAFLKSLGMACTFETKRDRLFTWKKR